MIVTVPLLVDGEVVERHVRVLGLAARVESAGLGALEAAVALVIETLMRGRARRVRRALQAQAGERVEVERAVGTALAVEEAPEDTQLVLFSQRERALFDAARHASRLARSQAHERMRLFQAPLLVATGPPVVEVLFDLRNRE